MIGAADAIAVGATARGDLIGIVGDCHRTAAVVSRSDRAVIGRRYFAGARHRGVGWEVVDHRRCLIINRDGLALAAAVVAGICSMIGPGDGIAIGATTRADLIGIVGDSHRTAAVVSRSDRAVIGRGPALAQDTVVLAGKLLIVGEVVSLTVMVCVQSAVLPLESVAL